MNPMAGGAFAIILVDELDALCGRAAPLPAMAVPTRRSRR